MRLLIDTNIFLEVILDRNEAPEAASLLRCAGNHEVFISDFSLHSIGVSLIRPKQVQTLREFLSDTLSELGFIIRSSTTGICDRM
jgi:hypothetical protein